MTIAIDTVSGTLAWNGLTGVRAVLRCAGAAPIDLLAGAEVAPAPAGGAVRARRTAGALRLELELEPSADGAVLEIGLAVAVADGGAEVRIEAVELAAAPLDAPRRPAGPLRFWRQWHDIWYAVGGKEVGRPPRAGEVEAEIAHLAGGVHAADGAWSLMMAYRLPTAWPALVAVEDGRLVARSLAAVAVRPREPWRSDRLRLAAGLPLARALAALHAVHQARRPAAAARDEVGWNSWEAYHGHVTAADMLENADAIAAIPWLRERVRTITVDDGWERLYGDWEPNARFPDGMDGLARRLEERGFRPGIWTAPFLADAESAVVRDHPEWLLHDEAGPVGSGPTVRTLDPTHPGVRAHLFALYQRLRGWGYRSFKTDFLRDPAMYALPHRPEHRPGLRLHDPALGMVRGMRAAMQAIRAGIGEDAFWLGCGTDIASGAGLMDASRTGGDIGPYWTRVPHQARSVIQHGPLHGALFLADPDFLLVKGPDTCLPGRLDVPEDSGKPYEADAWSGGRANDLAAVRAWASLVILSGGVVNLSDRMAILGPAGLAVIRTVLEHAGGEAAVPLDPASPIPRLLLRRTARGWLLGLFNWDHEAPAELAVEACHGVPFPAGGRVREVWTGEAVDCRAGALRATLPPRSARLLAWEA